MKVLIIEDTEEKDVEIRHCISSILNGTEVEFETVKYLGMATRSINTNQYDLIIADLFLPFTDGGTPQDAGGEIPMILQQSEHNHDAYVIGLSGYRDMVESQKQAFEEKGIILVHYDGENEVWKTILGSYIVKIRSEVHLDFVIICALEEERAAYKFCDVKLLKHDVFQRFDFQRMEINGLKGACILLPTMGLVEAAIIATRAVDVLNPRLVAMSGICGGISENCTFGQILVANPCWEYQSGKWAKDNFRIEPYQVDLDESIRLLLKKLIEHEGLMDDLEEGLTCDRPTKPALPKIAPFASGSAVIAKKEKIEDVLKQHRKVTGIDMEMYGLYKSVKLSKNSKTIFFGAKTVVDLANEHKDDSIHEYGAIVSARFVVRAIREALSCIVPT